MRKKNVISTVAAIALLRPVTGFAGLVIGDWESDLYGWIDWRTGYLYITE